MENKVTVIDVRTPMEYAGGKVEGSINIPVDQIPERLDELKAIEGEIVLCCASGMRSFSALKFLQQKGMTNVIDGGPWYNVASSLS